MPTKTPGSLTSCFLINVTAEGSVEHRAAVCDAVVLGESALEEEIKPMITNMASLKTSVRAAGFQRKCSGATITD